MSTGASTQRDVRIAWAAAPDRARRRTIAWSLLRDLLTEAGASPATRLHAVCTQCGGPHGPVEVIGAPWVASVTYAANIAVVALAPASSRAIGIDAEPVHDPVREAAGWEGTGASGPLDWVRREATHKADRRGLRLDPAGTRIVTESDGSWRAYLEGRADAILGWEPKSAPPGILLSVAMASEAGEAPAHPATR